MGQSRLCVCLGPAQVPGTAPALPGIGQGSDFQEDSFAHRRTELWGMGKIFHAPAEGQAGGEANGKAVFMGLWSRRQWPWKEPGTKPVTHSDQAAHIFLSSLRASRGNRVLPCRGQRVQEVGCAAALGR